MKQWVNVLILAVILLSPVAVNAAETKLEGRIYTGWWLNSGEGGDGYNAFTLDRSYMIAKSKLSDYTNVNITIDMRSIDNYKGYAMVVKYAYASWKPKFAVDYLTINLGVQPTKYLETVDGSFWLRRYIEKSTGDLNDYLSTADLGLNADLKLGQQGMYGNAGLSVFNGTKYSDLGEKNKQKDFNPYIILKPAPNSAEFGQTTLVAQFYSGTQNLTFNDTLKSPDYQHQVVSVGGKLGYKKTLDLGFDLNWNTLGQGKGKADKKQSALSGFGALSLGELVGEKSPLRTLGLIGRVDVVDPNTDVAKDGKTMVIVGVECAPIKGVMASLNYRTTSYQNDKTTATKYLYLNSEFRF